MKKGYKLFLAATLLLSQATLGLRTVSADSFDDQINAQRSKLASIQASQNAQNETLTSLQNEITSVEQQIDATKSELEAKNSEIFSLSQDISELELVIEKRTERIYEQARYLQTTSTIDTVLDAALSAESFIDAISTFFTLAQLTTSSQELLAQQQADKNTLSQKRLEVENAALQIAEKATTLDTLKGQLLEKTIEAQIVLTQLGIDAAQTEDEIASLSQQQEEARQALAAAQEAERIQREEAARQQAIIAATPTPVVQTQNTSTNTTTNVSQTNQATQTTQVATAQTSQNTTVSNTTTTAVTTPSASGFSYPITSPTITSPFGAVRQVRLQNGTYYSDVHNGVDFVNGNSAAPITASASGVVVSAGADSYGGLGVIIKHSNGMYTYYWHLSRMSVSVGQSVSAGQQVGIIGTTGLSTGIHLHFGMSTGLWSGFVNPMNYLR